MNAKPRSLSLANLRDADLRGSDLSNTSFERADLTGTKMDQGADDGS